MEKQKVISSVLVRYVELTAACLALAGRQDFLSTHLLGIIPFIQNPEEDNNRFVFNRNLATSYDPTGTYSVENSELILRGNVNEVYKFKINGNNLIFESGEYAEGLVEIGTIFELTKNK